jgi:DNA repair exonuclease SbcCD ATPase subunit
MSDLEGEQERTAGLSAALEDTRARLTTAESAREAAEARMARAQKQVEAANAAAAELETKAVALSSQLKVRDQEVAGLASALEAATEAGEAAEATGVRLRDRVQELEVVAAEHAALKAVYADTMARLVEAEAAQEVGNCMLCGLKRPNGCWSDGTPRGCWSVCVIASDPLRGPLCTAASMMCRRRGATMLSCAPRSLAW